MDLRSISYQAREFRLRIAFPRWFRTSFWSCSASCWFESCPEPILKLCFWCWSFGLMRCEPLGSYLRWASFPDICTMSSHLQHYRAENVAACCSGATGRLGFSKPCWWAPSSDSRVSALAFSVSPVQTGGHFLVLLSSFAYKALNHDFLVGEFFSWILGFGFWCSKRSSVSCRTYLSQAFWLYFWNRLRHFQWLCPSSRFQELWSFSDCRCSHIAATSPFVRLGWTALVFRRGLSWSSCCLPRNFHFSIIIIFSAHRRSRSHRYCRLFCRPGAYYLRQGLCICSVVGSFWRADPFPPSLCWQRSCQRRASFASLPSPAEIEPVCSNSCRLWVSERASFGSRFGCCCCWSSSLDSGPGSKAAISPSFASIFGMESSKAGFHESVDSWSWSSAKSSQYHVCWATDYEQMLSSEWPERPDASLLAFLTGSSFSSFQERDLKLLFHCFQQNRTPYTCMMTFCSCYCCMGTPCLDGNRTRQSSCWWPSGHTIHTIAPYPSSWQSCSTAPDIWSKTEHWAAWDWRANSPCSCSRHYTCCEQLVHLNCTWVSSAFAIYSSMKD